MQIAGHTPACFSSYWPVAQVLIYAPARTAGQQGKSSTIDGAGKGPGWKLIFQTQQKCEPDP